LKLWEDAAQGCSVITNPVTDRASPRPLRGRFSTSIELDAVFL